MRQFESPTTFVLPQHGNLTDDVVDNGAEHAKATAFRVHDGTGWVDVTAASFLDQVRETAGGLVSAGVEPGDRVALQLDNRYEWSVLDYAIWFAGAVTVPLLEHAGAEEVELALADSGARAVVVGTAEQATRTEGFRHRLESLDHVWCLADGVLGDLRDAGRSYPGEDLERLRTTIGPDAPAALVYSDGPDGRPRACLLTHGNLMWGAGVVLADLGELFRRDDASTLLVLPLVEVRALLVQVAAVRSRVRVGHCAGAGRLDEDLHSFAPTFLLATPPIVEQVLQRVRLRAAVDHRSRLLDQCLTSATACSRAVEKGGAGPLLRLRHAVLDRWAGSRLRAAWGGRCEYVVCAGAPLGDRLGHVHRGLGLTVLEAYGPAETAAVATSNRPDAMKIGTAGRPASGLAVRVSDGGELLVRGEQVTGRCWEQGAVTRLPVEEGGWLATGDLGEIDDEGFVRVTARRADLLVTSGGKTVSPALLERRIRAHLLVSQCLVVGDGRPFLAALVTLDPEALALWASRRGADASPTDPADDPALRAELQAAVDTANLSVSRSESVRRFLVLPDRWTEEAGQLTPGLEPRRSVVLAQLSEAVDELYAG